jgi:hypothetical protein
MTKSEARVAAVQNRMARLATAGPNRLAASFAPSPHPINPPAISVHISSLLQYFNCLVRAIVYSRNRTGNQD